MAKKKAQKEIEQTPIEEVVEEVATPIEEEVAPIEEKAVEEVEVKVEPSTDQFIFTQLKVINRMTNQAKAKRLAERVLRNRKKG